MYEFTEPEAVAIADVCPIECGGNKNVCMEYIQ